MSLKDWLLDRVHIQGLNVFFMEEGEKHLENKIQAPRLGQQLLKVK